MTRKIELPKEERDEYIKKLNRLRFEQRWSQKQLAEALGMCTCTVNRILNGKYNFSGVTVQRFDWLFDKYK